MDSTQHTHRWAYNMCCYKLNCAGAAEEHMELNAQWSLKEAYIVKLYPKTLTTFNLWYHLHALLLSDSLHWVVSIINCLTRNSRSVTNIASYFVLSLPAFKPYSYFIELWFLQILLMITCYCRLSVALYTYIHCYSYIFINCKHG